MRIRFWGVRGSVPFATPRSIGHGCNTPCIEVRSERTGAVLVLDAGSGIVGLGETLDARGPIPILLTHYHWDHILGLPFFAPLYRPGHGLALLTPRIASHDPGWLDMMFRSPFFPLPFERLREKPSPRMVEPGRVDVDGFTVSALALNHPGGSLAYRIAGASGDLVYATDHEFGDPVFDEPLAAFAQGAAAIVLDAHFTPDELPRYAGWGHSDWRRCAEFAASAGVGALYLFHHKPGRSDADLSTIQQSARAIFAATHAAAEGQIFSV